MVLLPSWITLILYITAFSGTRRIKCAGKIEVWKVYLHISSQHHWRPLSKNISSGRCYQSAEGQKAVFLSLSFFWEATFACLPSNCLLKDKIQLGLWFYEKLCFLMQRSNIVSFEKFRCEEFVSLFNSMVRALQLALSSIYESCWLPKLFVLIITTVITSQYSPKSRNMKN